MVTTPPDIAPMRATAATLPAADAPLPRFDDLAHTVSRLHAHFTVLLPAVEAAALALPDASEPRAAALAAFEDARAALAAGPEPGLVSATRHAQSLARTLHALCDHYETLTKASVREHA
jgi:hypothetical protein